ncbi:hypothetical protein ALC62_15974 [Cyphomyrmex costatus]|uniref:Uncharacterized protein n=1 Tax=Cyphomyrmex costatus TaxID=456900 RepID=A0A195C0C6_9HYME|nr:hypothetical protein ALC62_15974 [Cyphomyrmex costatus]
MAPSSQPRRGVTLAESTRTPRTNIDSGNVFTLREHERRTRGRVSTITHSRIKRARGGYYNTGAGKAVRSQPGHNQWALTPGSPVRRRQETPPPSTTMTTVAAAAVAGVDETCAKVLGREPYDTSPAISLRGDFDRTPINIISDWIQSIRLLVEQKCQLRIPLILIIFFPSHVNNELIILYTIID